MKYMTKKRRGRGGGGRNRREEEREEEEGKEEEYTEFLITHTRSFLWPEPHLLSVI